MDSQQTYNTEREYASAEDSEESDSEQIERIFAKRKRKHLRPVEAAYDVNEASEQECSQQCIPRCDTEEKNNRTLSKNVSKRKWTTEETVHLIECLESHPCL